MKAKQQLIFIIITLCFILGGCSQNASDKTDHSLKGRYVEQKLILPEGALASNMMLTQKDNKPFLYCFLEAPATITGYQLNSDGTWTESTPTWLKSLTSLPSAWSYQSQIMEDTNGYQYLYYTELINDNMKASLLRSTDGSTYKVLHPEGWDENGTYNVPAKVTILEDGTLAAIFSNGEVTTYDPTTQKVINTLADVRYYNEFLSSIGNKLILGKCDENNMVKGIDIYDLGDMSSVNYPFEVTMYSYSYCTTNGKKDILLCNADGVFKLEDGTSLWNTIIDGTLTSLAMPTMRSAGFVCDASDNYYVLYNSDSGYSLMQYTYDETVDTLPTSELNIYSLTDNYTLRQAAAVFQQEHTDVKINFTIAMTQEEYQSATVAIKEDYIRALNTELLAGSDYDILVLDGLPAASFIEKSVLSDMSDLLLPMIDKGILSKNIMGNYIKNGKIYSVPAKFGINVLFGRTADTKNLTTLKALADYAANNMADSLFGSLTLEDLINIFAPYQINEILGSDGKINRDNLINTLNALKQISDNCGIVADYSGEISPGNYISNFNRGTILSLYTMKNFLDAIYPFGMTAHFNGSYTSFENSFTPICELGINSNSEQTVLSKEFIRMVLSEDIQIIDFYDGFPINSQALINSSLQDRSDYSVDYSSIDEEGNDSMLTLEALNKKQTEDVVTICSAVTNEVTANEYITAAIKAKSTDFFQGGQSASDAADAIIEELNVYLSE